MYLFSIIFLLIVCVCVYVVCVCMCVCWYALWGSEDIFVELVLSCHLSVGSKTQILVLGLRLAPPTMHFFYFPKMPHADKAKKGSQ